MHFGVNFLPASAQDCIEDRRLRKLASVFAGIEASRLPFERLAPKHLLDLKQDMLPAAHDNRCNDTPLRVESQSSMMYRPDDFLRVLAGESTRKAQAAKGRHVGSR